MLRSDEYDDLCIDCSNSDNCIIRINKAHPIWFCQEYIGTKDFRKINSPIMDTLNIADEEENIEQKKGICKNCIHHETCGLSNSDTGIWHCERFE